MGNDPLCIIVAQAAVKNSRPLGATMVKDLLNHIDALQTKLDRIDEDRDEQ